MEVGTQTDRHTHTIGTGVSVTRFEIFTSVYPTPTVPDVVYLNARFQVILL